jgi:hypothetical protein
MNSKIFKAGEVSRGPIRLDYYGIGNMVEGKDPYALHPKHDFISSFLKKPVTNENQPLEKVDGWSADVSIENRDVVVANSNGEK